MGIILDKFVRIIISETNHDGFCPVLNINLKYCTYIKCSNTQK